MMLRNVVEANDEKPFFQLFYLKDDEDQSVEVACISYLAGRPLMRKKLEDVDITSLMEDLT